MSASYKVPIKCPENDLAWVCYLMRRCLTNSEKFKGYPTYTVPECIRMGISRKCLRAMERKDPLFV
jgi:hypothetical protein